MIGDRLVDVAFNLGVVPAAMSVRCSLWPMCEHLKTVVQVLGCPKCLSKKKAVPLLKFAQQHGIKRVLIEKSDPFCLYVQTSPEKIASFLHGKGLAIDYVDFTKGLGNAVRQAADLLGCAEKVGDVLAVYDKAMKQTRAKMDGKQFPGKVVILKGVYQNETGKAFIQVEAPGGYSDRFMLKPMACENVGGRMYSAEKKPSKGHVVVRKLDGLAAAAPDAIIMTGHAIAVQKVLAQAIQKHPALVEVPAIKTQAIYSLDGYIDSSVLEYPLILRRWADVLAR
jgi:ABC-type Fe3+-hydroxamate transport system substrate-binding protein